MMELSALGDSEEGKWGQEEALGYRPPLMGFSDSRWLCPFQGQFETREPLRLMIRARVFDYVGLD